MCVNVYCCHLNIGYGFIISTDTNDDVRKHGGGETRVQEEKEEEELLVKVVVGREVSAGSEWRRRGRVEEKLLIATAHRFNYNIQVSLLLL